MNHVIQKLSVFSNHVQEKCDKLIQSEQETERQSRRVLAFYTIKSSSNVREVIGLYSTWIISGWKRIRWLPHPDMMD